MGLNFGVFLLAISTTKVVNWPDLSAEFLWTLQSKMVFKIYLLKTEIYYDKFFR